MATDSDIKLTKYESTVTVVTADFANSIFGGLYGSADGSSLDEDDPRVRGHVHSGLRGDGNAPRVHLVEHVIGQLTNHNLADDAVAKRNVFDSLHIDDAIPEYRVDEDGDTYYYLDLRHIRADFVLKEDEDPAGDGSQHRLIRQRSQVWDDSILDVDGNPAPDYAPILGVWDTGDGFDLVIGSSSLDDLDSGTDGDSRLQFDKSKSAFRAGQVDGDQWDEVNRGMDSVALGHNVAATAERSTVSGGSENRAEASGSTVAGGDSNVASGIHSSISGGEGNAATAEGTSIGGGLSNKAEASGSTVTGGANNRAQGDSSFVGGGDGNFAIGEESAVAGGYGNEAGGKHATVGGGSSNSAGAEGSTVSGGGGTTGNLISATSSWATIGGGLHNEIAGAGSSVSGGEGNIIAGELSTISGGEGNRITGELSTICGGGGTDKNTITSKGSSITGGSLNTVSSDYSAILGGYNNLVESNSKYGAIVGGLTNKVEGDHSVIIGGSNAYISGLSSVSVGGSSSKIVDSDGSITVGSGDHTEPLTIGHEYVSLNMALVPSTPSPMSGVVGGYSNHIAGGYPAQAKNNFLVGGSGNKLGGIAAYVVNSQIFGGFGNEVAAYATKAEPGHIDHGLIVGGEQNFILMGQASSDVLYPGIIGGFQNSINWIPHEGDAFGYMFTPWSHSIAPWFRPSSYGTNSTDGSIGEPEAGVQTSYIFGGVKNSISNSIGASFGDGSLYSATLGGHSNVISSGHGSSILGGGAFVNTLGGSLERPPYDTHSEYYANVIQGGHHSSILNGSSNLIKQYAFPFSDAGPQWSTNGSGDALGVGTNNGVYEKDFLPEPLFCVAEGRESYSYLYGQHAHASGGHDKDRFNTDQNFFSASVHHNPTSSVLPTPSPAEYMVQLGSEVDGKGATLNQPGSAQTSSLDFFGSWTYSQGEIPSAIWVDTTADGEPDWIDGDAWRPATWNNLNSVSATNTPWFEFRSYLGGGRDDINAATYGPNRCFIPRFPASYQFVINGALSFTSMYKGRGTSYGGKYGIGLHEVISFTYTGYIVMQPDGGGKYGGVLSNVMSSDGEPPGRALTLFDPTAIGGVLGLNGLTGSNFSIGFCPHWLIGYGAGEAIWPVNAYQDSTLGSVVGTSCYGSWNEPSTGVHGTGHDGVSSWPPKFSLYVVNNTGDPTALGGGNGTGELLIGESLVARAEVSENLLFLGRYNTSIPNWTQP